MWLRWLLDLAGLAVWIRALVLVIGRPRADWRRGRLSQAAALAVVLVAAPTAFGVWWPLGAALVWWRIRCRGERDRFELPMADGRRGR